MALLRLPLTLLFALSPISRVWNTRDSGAVEKPRNLLWFFWSTTRPFFSRTLFSAKYAIRNPLPPLSLFWSFEHSHFEFVSDFVLRISSFCACIVRQTTPAIGGFQLPSLFSVLWPKSKIRRGGSRRRRVVFFFLSYCRLGCLIIRKNPRNPRFLFLLVIWAFGFRYCFGFRASYFGFLLLAVLCAFAPPCLRGFPNEIQYTQYEIRFTLHAPRFVKNSLDIQPSVMYNIHLTK